MRLLLLDNLDSFTYNLADMCRSSGARVDVCRANDLPMRDMWSKYSHLMLSPGPKRPQNHPANEELLKVMAGKIPILGVCLGMQAINEWLGGTLKLDSPPSHGKCSSVIHNGEGIFQDVPSPILVARYHSIVVDRLGENLEVSCHLEKSHAMGIKHKQLPIYGVQFHPESFMTEYGTKIVNNFLQL